MKASTMLRVWCMSIAIIATMLTGVTRAEAEDDEESKTGLDPRCIQVSETIGTPRGLNFTDMDVLLDSAQDIMKIYSIYFCRSRKTQELSQLQLSLATTDKKEILELNPSNDLDSGNCQNRKLPTQDIEFANVFINTKTGTISGVEFFHNIGRSKILFGKKTTTGEQIRFDIGEDSRRSDMRLLGIYGTKQDDTITSLGFIQRNPNCDTPVPEDEKKVPDRVPTVWSELTFTSRPVE